MIDVHFVLIGALCSATCGGIYARDTLRGTTVPNRVSFVLWGMAPMLAFAVEIQEGVGLRATLTFMVGAMPLVILAASLKGPGRWELRPFDYACGALSIAGTVVWLVTRIGVVGIGASIAADALAGLPTMAKSWKAPDTESAIIYGGAIVNAGITLLTVKTATFAVVAFPLYILVFATILLVLVAGRAGPSYRRIMSAKLPE